MAYQEDEQTAESEAGCSEWLQRDLRGGQNGSVEKETAKRVRGEFDATEDSSQ